LNTTNPPSVADSEIQNMSDLGSVSEGHGSTIAQKIPVSNVKLIPSVDVNNLWEAAGRNDFEAIESYIHQGCNLD